MGVHTWFYKKVDGPSHEEGVIIIREYLQKCIDESVNALSIGDNDYFDFLSSIHGNHNDKSSQDNYIKELKKDLSDLDSGIMPSDLFYDFVTMILNIAEYIPGKGFYNDPDHDLPHNPFRGGNYGDHLFSLEETLEFLENNKILEEMNQQSKEHWESIGKKQVYDFWEKYPDGLISLG